MNIIEESFKKLYPERILDRIVTLKYSGKFKPYNANVKYTVNSLTFNLSKTWRSVDKEIKIGLIQSLLVKIFRQKEKTINIEMYDIFMKKLWTVAPKDKIDSVLLESFERVNDEYFNGLIEIPNLIWSGPTTSKLGSYEYATDTINMSSIFKDQPIEYLDYVMHHEMLHKKLQYTNSGMKTMHHTAEFRLREKSFRNAEQIERKIGLLARSKKQKQSFFSFLK